MTGYHLRQGRRTATVAGLVSVFVLVCIIPVQANWPHIRGPGYDGHSTWTGMHLPKGQDGPAVVWKRQLGQGYSGFVIVDGRAYTQVQSRGGQYVICLRLTTGEEIWRTRYAWPWELDGEWPGPYGTPTYENGRIFFVGCYGTIGCLNASDGDVVWTVSLTDDIKAEIPGFGYASTPLVFDGRVYLPASGKRCSVIALDADDGTLLWRAGDMPATYSSCIPVRVLGHTQIVTCLENFTVAHDPATGVELWRKPWSTGYDPQPAWPLYREPYLFRAAAFQGGAGVLKLSYDSGHASAAEVWRSEVMSNDIYSGVTIGDHVYGFDIVDSQTARKGGTEGTFKCINLETGQEMWSTNATGHASIMVCDDKLLILNESGMFLVAEATPRGYQELVRWQALTGEKCWTFPALCDGYLILRGEKTTVCLYIGDPALITLSTARTVRHPGDTETVIGSWLNRYHSDSFWAPTLSEQLEWYLFCILAVLLPAWVLIRRMRTDTWARRAIFTGTALLLGICGMPFFTWATGRFIFTLPTVVFLALVLTIHAGNRFRKSEHVGMVLARAPLAIFLLLCAAYYFLCRLVFLPAGWGYLVGLIPVSPIAYVLASRWAHNLNSYATAGTGLLVFSVYFWASAFFTVWKTGS